MTRPAYPLALILGALSACAVFAAGEAIDRSGHNPFETREVAYGRFG